MHPILSSRSRTLLYLASWLPIAALLTAIVTRSGQMPQAEAAIVLFPMCLIYAFICQGFWYVCQAIPLRKSAFFRLLAIHAAAANVSSIAWLAIGFAWAVVVQT